ncbi:hypothetical protein QTN47_20905 [Danxiaibacter flavus]|uniref:CBM11 domain-containing protein n=1 Tax=Danxiaibacter flavus TaxID=3049108 RepID=A0ABV3ZJB8_9BACT|nr:hypothetical protein QNM32_20910 [Chitinophagaceae bacterium DXS]
MKLSKLILITSLLAVGIFIAHGCKKESYTSRDTSGLKPPPVEPPPPVDSSLVTFDAADDKAGWETVGDPVVVSAGQKEGNGYIQGSITAGNDFLQFIKTRTPALDAKLTKDNGQLMFWLNIPDVSKLKKDGQIQISSSGQPDSKRYGWPLADLIPALRNGWNQIILNFNEANEAGDGGADMSSLNYFKIFFWTTDKATANFTCGIDGIQLRKRPAGEQTGVGIDNCDDATGWETVGTPVIVTSGQKEGAGYLQGTIKSGGDFLQFIKTLPANLNTKATLLTGQLQFWFYVQDVSVLKADGQIQFSSSKDPDKNRIGWALAPIIPTLRNGWNLLKLNFADGGITGDGGPDLTAMNYFKIFFWTKDKAAADYNFGLDDIKVVLVPPPAPVVVDACDDATGWETVGTPVIVTQDQKEGAGYLQGTIKAGGDFLQFIKTLPDNIDTKVTIDNGQLQFWFYVPDPAILKLDGQIQFSSSKDPDKKRVGWPLAKVIPNLKKGWNLVSLNMWEGEQTGDGGPDLTAMNYFKIFFWPTDKPTADVNFGLDGIIVQRGR